MKVISSILLLFLGAQALAISSSTPVGPGAGISQFDVHLIRSFNLADGNAVTTENAITQLSYRDVWLGSSALLLTVNGKRYNFKLNQRVNITKGYPVVSHGTTAASQTGQGIAVSVRQDYGAYSPTTYTEYETSSCYGSTIQECKDFSHTGYGYQCLSETLTGRETLLIEYSEQRLPALLILSAANGKKLVEIDYMTRAFDKRTLQTVDYCDANDYFNEVRTRDDLRRRLLQMYGKPKGKVKPPKVKKH